MAKRTQQKPKKEPVFEIGLVMAGAISAGAYTAGVTDFLIEALDQWYTAKENKVPDCPPHNVKLKVLSGASAGAMTAGITAAALGGDIEPVREIKPWKAVNNKLYEAWVQKIDIEHLLGTDDLRKNDGPVKSLLDSTILDDIAENVFTVSQPGKRRTYIDDPLDLYLSITNLRGVPYNIGFKGATEAGHELSLRSDYIRFQLSSKKNIRAGIRKLDPGNYNDPAWRDLAEASLASGAFPIGLAPKILSRSKKEYAKRKWPVPVDPRQRNQTGDCIEMTPIDPAWPDDINKQQDYEYRFVSVDGGVLDNEPLELARKTLAQADVRNKRSGKEANRAVILIDPFPHDAPFKTDYETKDDIFNIIPALLSSLRTQARFKPDELILAQREDIYSRYLIAPKRRAQNGKLAEFPIASGLLGGFGGFLSLSFREHDYQLGRRNCQMFLKEHFALPYGRHHKNPLFDNWTREMIHNHRIKEGNEVFLPIIPLVGTAAEEVPPPPWPSYSLNNLQPVKRQLKRRINAVAGRLVDLHIPYWPVRLGLKTVLTTIICPRTVNEMVLKIEKELKTYEFT